MRSALGKGLDALISEDTAASVAAALPKPSGPVTIAIDRVRPNAKQPRHTFSSDSLNELSASIQERGVLQPILVAPLPDGSYEIIAGERRWRAAQKAGLSEIPVILRGGTETERFEMALIENIQREDLNPIELALGYRRLQEEFGLTQEAIAKAVGKDRAVVANTLRLLNLSDEIQQVLQEGKISAGHGRALVALEDIAARQELFQRIISEALPVRIVEQVVRVKKQTPASKQKRSSDETARPVEIRAIEEELQRLFGRKVHLHGDASHKGWIKLEFYSLDDFDALIALLRKTTS
ncbi:MAG: ParB/RepB/Spo0J family partition protein [Elusimicrobiota bacterium]|jgi:ParB family chromosome partitioning protein